MSNAAQSLLPDPQQAYDTVFQNVWSDTFFKKLASFGHVPQNQKQAQALLELSGKLETVENDPAIKFAGDAGVYGQASQALDNLLAAQGLDGPLKQASATNRDTALAKYAMQLMQVPELYNSVLSLKAAEASQLAAQ